MQKRQCPRRDVRCAPVFGRRVEALVRREDLQFQCVGVTVRVMRDAVERGGIGQRDDRPGIGDDGLETVGGAMPARWIGGYADQAGVQASDPCADEFQPGRIDQQDAIARLRDVLQPGGDAARPLVEVAEREPGQFRFAVLEKMNAVLSGSTLPRNNRISVTVLNFVSGSLLNLRCLLNVEYLRTGRGDPAKRASLDGIEIRASL